VDAVDAKHPQEEGRGCGGVGRENRAGSGTKKCEREADVAATEALTAVEVVVGNAAGAGLGAGAAGAAGGPAGPHCSTATAVLAGHQVVPRADRIAGQ
jgi:hypothetical protein